MCGIVGIAGRTIGSGDVFSAQRSNGSGRIREGHSPRAPAHF